VYDKGKQIGSTTVGADGKWSFTPDTPLADGLHMLSYSAVDRAGNSGEQSEVNEFFVDTRPEKINIYYAEDDVGSVTGEVFSGGVTDDSTPTLFGTATAGGVVKIYEGNVLLGQVTADVDGTWQFTPPTALSEGAHTFQATVTLPAKGESERSKPFKLEVDFTAPAEPTIDQVMDDAGAIQGVVESGQTTDDATPTLSGKAEKGSIVRIFSNGNLLGGAQADANGEWLFTPAKSLADGAHTFTITASDAAGNQTASAVPYEIHIDTLRPEAPTIVSVEDDVGQVQGFLQKGDPTDDTQPTFKGAAEANSTVIVRDNGVEIGRVQANGEGEWSFTPVLALSGGAHGITVVALDKAGNVSVPSDSFDFSVIVVPAEPAAAPTIDSIYDDVGLAKGLLASGAVTDDSMPLVSGKGVPNTTVILKDNGVEVGRSLVDAAGDWTFLPSAPLSFGLHNLVATTVDIAGNLGRSSGVFGFRVVELGRAGAMENFNTLPYDLVSTGNGEAVVLPTGVKLSGTFYGEDQFNGSSASRPGDPRPEDTLVALGVSLGQTVRIELSSESGIISYHIGLWAGPTVVNYFDVDGKKIGSKNYPTNNTIFHREVFEAPVGSMVASIEVKAGTSGFAAIEALQWGERYITGVSIAEASADHLGGRVIYGMVTGVAHLKSNEVVQVSTDGGKTWTNATFSESSWVAIQKDMPPGNWVAEVRVVDKNSGLSFGLSDTKVVEVVGAGAPRIERIEEAEGMYTAAKAADGTAMEVSLDSTGAKVGDILHIRWGVTTYDHVLTKANIDSGHASIKIPSEQTNWQGAYKDFSVTAQIIGGGGAIGTLSDSYKVVGTYAVSAAIKDVLQTKPQDNAYIGTGFKITTEGVMTKTALTESSYAGLTLSGESETTALFTLDKPAREISLRLSGLDSPLGAKIQIFNIQGSLIEEQLVYGDATVFHAKLFSYVSKDERVDIGSFKIVAHDSSVTLDGFIRKEVTHIAEARDPNLLDSSMESFYGTDGDDIVTITMRPDSYFAGVTAGIHGGDGVDILRVANQTEVGSLNLGDRVSSMEIIELNSSTGWHAQQSVFVTVSDVLRNGATDAFYVGDKSRVQMMIKDCGTASSIALHDNLYSGMNLNDRGGSSGDIGDWVKKSAVTIGGVVYDSYQHSGINVEVLTLPKSLVYITNRAEYIEPWKEIYYKAASASSSELYSESSVLQAAHTDLFAPESNALHYSGVAGSNFGPAASSVQSFGLDPLDSHYALNAY
ncbi:MAG TPA: hypothetical protein DCY59_09780, partial [Micrococcaceae bacterium]|nr:hypothetical protein [Micrococcaceae bacterium]